MPGGAGPFQNAPDVRYERRGQAAVRTQDQVNSLELTLNGKDKFFGSAGMGPDYDWPNPQRQPPGRAHVAATQSQEQVRVNLLLTELKGKDQLFGAAGETKTFDWPNPDRYRAARFIVPANAQGWVTTPPIFLLLPPTVNVSKFTGKGALSPPSTAAASSKFLGYAVLEPAPLNFRRASDWGNNPRGYLYPVSLRTWTDPLKLNLLGQDALPFGQGDWPNPLGPRWLRPDEAAASPLALVAPPSPVLALDWPNPQGPAHAVALRGWTQNAILGGPAPFAQGDWPNPTRAPRTEQGWAAALNLALNLFGDVPFNQTNWPNPKGYRRGDATLTVQPPPVLGFLATSKFLGYGGLSPPDDALAAAKFLGLAGLSPPIDAASAAKFLGLGALSPSVDALVIAKLIGYAVLAPPRDLYLDAFSLMRALDEDAAGRMSGATLDGTGAMSGTLDLFARL